MKLRFEVSLLKVYVRGRIAFHSCLFFIYFIWCFIYIIFTLPSPHKTQVLRISVSVMLLLLLLLFYSKHHYRYHYTLLLGIFCCLCLHIINNFNTTFILFSPQRIYLYVYLMNFTQKEKRLSYDEIYLNVLLTVLFDI